MRTSFRFRALWLCALLAQFSACGTIRSLAPPTLTVVPLRLTPGDGTHVELKEDAILHVREPAYLDIRVDRPAYVAAVLYAPAGTSEWLNPEANEQRLAANTALRVTVPRRAPGGVPEPALQVYVYASVQPLSPLLTTLLHLPCPPSEKNRGRGDHPDSSPPAKPQPSPTKEDRKPTTSGDKGPTQEPPRGDAPIDRICPASPGLTPPVTIRALLLRSE